MANRTIRRTRRQFLAQSVAATAAATIADEVLASQAPAGAAGLPTRVLGRTGQRVSILCLGGWHIGSVKDRGRGHPHHARGRSTKGMTFFDNCLGLSRRRSEEVMGQALASSGRRDKVFLMTKNCERDYAGSMKCLDDSLRRLRTDRIDLWQFHEIIYDNDPDWVFEQGRRSRLRSRRARRARCATSASPATRIRTFISKMLAKTFDWDACQMPINVLDAHYRSFQKQVVPVCAKKQVGVIGMKGMGGGNGIAEWRRTHTGRRLSLCAEPADHHSGRRHHVDGGSDRQRGNGEGLPADAGDRAGGDRRTREAVRHRWPLRAVQVDAELRRAGSSASARVHGIARTAAGRRRPGPIVRCGFAPDPASRREAAPEPEAATPASAALSGPAAAVRLCPWASAPSISTRRRSTSTSTCSSATSGPCRSAAALGRGLRPHTKTHKIPEIARMQLEAGAVGITVAKIGEAEVLPGDDVLDRLPDHGRQAAAAAGAGEDRAGSPSSSTRSRPPGACPASARWSRWTSAPAAAASTRPSRWSPSPAPAASSAGSSTGRRGSTRRRFAKARRSIDEHIAALTAAGFEVPDRVGRLDPGGVARPRSIPPPPRSARAPTSSTTRAAWPTTWPPSRTCALRVLVTVVSTAVPGQCVVDGGTKTFSSDATVDVGHPRHLPRPPGLDHAQDERGARLREDRHSPPRIGEKVWVVPSHVCTTRQHARRDRLRPRRSRRGDVEGAARAAACASDAASSAWVRLKPRPLRCAGVPDQSRASAASCSGTRHRTDSRRASRRLGDRRRVHRLAGLGRRQADAPRAHDRVVLPRQPQPALVGRRPVGDGDAAQRHHAGRHDRPGVQRRPALHPVLLRAAARDDHPVGDASSRSSIGRASITAYEYLERRFDPEDAHADEPPVSACRAAMACGAIVAAPAVVLSVILGWDVTSTTLAICVPGGHLHDARRRAGRDVDRREGHGADGVRPRRRRRRPRRCSCRTASASPTRCGSRGRPAGSTAFDTRFDADGDLHALVRAASAACS